MEVQLMGFRNDDIGATKGGLGCAECSVAAEKLLLTCPKMAKTLEETLEKRWRYRLTLHLDVLNQQ
jgi:hypothetical protein